MPKEIGLGVDIGPVSAVHSNFHDLETLTAGIWFWSARAGGSLAAGQLEDWMKMCVGTKPRPIEPQRRQERKENLFHNEHCVFRKRSTPFLL